MGYTAYVAFVFVLGLGLMLAGVFNKKARRRLLIAGGGLCALAALGFAVLAVLVTRM